MEKAIVITSGKVDEFELNNLGLKAITGTITLEFTSNGDFSEFINGKGEIDTYKLGKKICSRIPTLLEIK